MADIELKPCPFCGCPPFFSRAEWQDENRYVGMTLECCVTMTGAISWRIARDMTPEQHDASLRSNLTERWNERQPETTEE